MSLKFQNAQQTANRGTVTSAWPSFRSRPLPDTLPTTCWGHKWSIAALPSRLAEPLESWNLLANGETFISRSTAEWRGESCARTKWRTPCEGRWLIKKKKVQKEKEFGMKGKLCCWPSPKKPNGVVKFCWRCSDWRGRRSLWFVRTDSWNWTGSRRSPTL